MTVLRILQDGDPILRQVAAQVVTFDDHTVGRHDLLGLAIDMQHTLRALDGVGIAIAAPQVGHSIRMIVIGKSVMDVLVNPVILRKRGSFLSSEGCLSVPRSRWGAKVMRAKRVDVAYQDVGGGHHRIKADGLRAAVLQHEIDHLDGILFTDLVVQREQSLYRAGS